MSDDGGRLKTTVGAVNKPVSRSVKTVMQPLYVVRSEIADYIDLIYMLIYLVSSAMRMC